MLLQIAVYFYARDADVAAARNFRVGLFVARGDGIVPMRAVDLNNPNYDVNSSYRQHPQAFRLRADGENESHVARCIRLRRMLIVEDCVGAEKRKEFVFFHAEQASYLRSMVTYYLDEIREPNGTKSYGALVIDTDSAGYFTEADRDSLEFALRELVLRVKLELMLHAILTNHHNPDEAPAQ